MALVFCPGAQEKSQRSAFSKSAPRNIWPGALRADPWKGAQAGHRWKSLFALRSCRPKTAPKGRRTKGSPARGALYFCPRCSCSHGDGSRSLRRAAFLVRRSECEEPTQVAAAVRAARSGGRHCVVVQAGSEVHRPAGVELETQAAGFGRGMAEPVVTDGT